MGKVRSSVGHCVRTRLAAKVFDVLAQEGVNFGHDLDLGRSRSPA